MQEQFFPWMDPEPEMGTAAAAVCDTLPPHLRQIPSTTPSETATDNGGAGLSSPSAIARMMEMITQAMRGDAGNDARNGKKKMDGMSKNMDANTRKMEAMAQTMREEMQCMGAGLQKGLEGVKEGQRQF